MGASKRRIAVLYDSWDEDAAPEPDKPAIRKRRTRKRKEKHDREEIFEALDKLGYEPFYHVLDGHTPSLVALARCSPDLVFNLTESYAGDDTKDMNIAAYLDLLGCAIPGPARTGIFSRKTRQSQRRCLSFMGSRRHISRPRTAGELITLMTSAYP